MELGKKRQIARSQWNKEYSFEYVHLLFFIWENICGSNEKMQIA
jgi:hypothetical protein